jgi:hypothetical protein
MSVPFSDCAMALKPMNKQRAAKQSIVTTRFTGVPPLRFASMFPIFTWVPNNFLGELPSLTATNPMFRHDVQSRKHV